MLNIFKLDSLRTALEKSAVWIAVAMMALAGLTPIILQNTASAAQLTSRNVVITTSQASATGVNYRFNFTLPTSVDVQSILFQFCTSAQGTCTKPTGLDINYTLTSLNASQTFSEATAFTEFTGADAGACDDHNNGTPANSTEYCVTRTDTDSETDSVNKSIQIDNITNPSVSGNNTPVYTRIYLYSDTAFATQEHEGVVVASIINQLSVTGRVQERLVFCAFALDDTSASNATAGTANGEQPSSCAATEAGEEYDVDIGIIDNSTIAQSPVDNNPPTSLGDDRFPALQVNTNASNGVAITYYATAASTGTEELRAFRVGGATCVNGGTDLQDQCFISADETTGETFTAGTERFGLQIACVANLGTSGSDLGSTNNLGADGTGNGTAGTFNAVYSNTDDDVDDNVATRDCENEDTGVKFAWNDTSTAQALISSDTVVDDEIVKMNFGATAAATTPTGTYTAAGTFIATATF